jgi:excisionase family DNA binding protein
MVVADDEILNVAQVCVAMGVTPQTVRSWLRSGKLKGRRVGKGFRIMRSDMMAMLDQAPSAQRDRECGLWDRPAVPLGTHSETPLAGPIQVWSKPDAPSPRLVPRSD